MNNPKPKNCLQALALRVEHHPLDEIEPHDMARMLNATYKADRENTIVEMECQVEDCTAKIVLSEVMGKLAITGANTHREQMPCMQNVPRHLMPGDSI